MASSSSATRIASAARDRLVVGQRPAGGPLGLRQVRGHDGRAGIGGEVDLLGVDHAGDAPAPAAVDDRPRQGRADRPLLVVGQHDRGLFVEQGQDPSQQVPGGRGEGRAIAVAVQPQELLLAFGEDPRLADRLQAGPLVQHQPGHALGVQRIAELRPSTSVPTRPASVTRAQGGQRRGDVAGPAGGVDFPRQAHHRHRRLGRDPPHVPVHVPVEHHVAHDHRSNVEHRIAGSGIHPRGHRLRPGAAARSGLTLRLEAVQHTRGTASASTGPAWVATHGSLMDRTPGRSARWLSRSRSVNSQQDACVSKNAPGLRLTRLMDST